MSFINACEKPRECQRVLSNPSAENSLADEEDSEFHRVIVLLTRPAATRIVSRTVELKQSEQGLQSLHGHMHSVPR